MKPRTLDLILKACLTSMVLALPVFFFNEILAASVIVIATVVLLFSSWEAWKLLKADPDAFKTQSKSQKELSLKDLPPKLIIALAAAFIIISLAQFSLFSFNPIIDALLTALGLLLAIYYFFQKRRLQKKA